MEYYPIIDDLFVKYIKKHDIAKIELAYNGNIKYILNETAEAVFLFCKKNMSTAEIVEQFYQHYGENNSKEQLTVDIFEILRQFYNLGFLKWKGNNPFCEYLISENSFHVEKLWIGDADSINKKIDFLNPYLDRDTFLNVENIKFQIVVGKESFLRINNNNEKQFDIMIEKDKYSNMYIINYIKIYNLSEFRFNFMKFIEEYTKYHFGINSGKSEVCYVINQSNPNMEKLFLDFGFEKLTTLTNELPSQITIQFLKLEKEKK